MKVNFKMRYVSVETPVKIYTLSCFTFESEKLPSQPRRSEINMFQSYLLLQTRKISRRVKKKNVKTSLFSTQIKFVKSFAGIFLRLFTTLLNSPNRVNLEKGCNVVSKLLYTEAYIFKQKITHLIRQERRVHSLQGTKFHILAVCWCYEVQL